MHRRYGWQGEDLSAAMMQLLPAAVAGFQHFGNAGAFGTGPQPGSGIGGLGNPFFPPVSGANPFAWPQDPLRSFYGPEPVRTMVVDHIARATGLQREAIGTMMPVAATLAAGTMMRPYLNESGQGLLDAFLRGFVRGRPKPRPTPADYIQEYQQAVGAFWSAFFKPSQTNAGKQTESYGHGGTDTANLDPAGLDPAGGASVEDVSNQPETAPQAQVPTEFEQFFNDWMTTNRDLQTAQFKAFDGLFESAARKLDGSEET